MGGSNRPILFAIGGIVVGIGAGVAIGWFSKVRSVRLCFIEYVKFTL